MSVGLIYPHIEKAAGQPARLQRVPRVRVAQIVLNHLAYGWSAEEILRQHEYLKPAEVHAALGYYYDHQDEIDEEISTECEEARKAHSAGHPSPFLLRLRARGLR